MDVLDLDVQRKRSNYDSVDSERELKSSVNIDAEWVGSAEL